MENVLLVSDAMDCNGVSECVSLKRNLYSAKKIVFQNNLFITRQESERVLTSTFLNPITHR